MLRYLFVVFLLVPQISFAGHVESNELAQLLIDEARALWQSHDLSNYKFTLDRGGVFGRIKFRVQVKGGECVKVTYWRRFRRYQEDCENRTISDLFDELDEAILDDPINIWLEFDSKYGFPTEVLVEPRTDLTDQDWGYSISRFRH